MSGPTSRLAALVSHFLPGHKDKNPPVSGLHIHQLSPTFFLPRAAEIEPDAVAIYHVTANGHTIRRSYIDFADRARGLAYYLMKNGFKRVGILAPNTPAFLESIFGIAAAGAVSVAVNYRLKVEDVEYIFNFAEVSERYCPFFFRKTSVKTVWLSSVG
jgi:acyl-CoA synthetase (AMP-forming)/AMP-acid ligase II